MPTVEALLEGLGPDAPSLEELLGIEPDEAESLRLRQPSPMLGRYFRQVKFLRNVTSSSVVGQVRFYVLTERLIALNNVLSGYTGIHKNKRIIHSLTEDDIAQIRLLGRSTADVFRAERIEQFTEHDTAAAGDYLKILIASKLPHLAEFMEAMAFADTSEDTMGPTFGLIANHMVYGHFIPKVLDFVLRMLDFVDAMEAQFSEAVSGRRGPLVIPEFTHDQCAEPTTFGKVFTTNLKSIMFHVRRLTNTNGEFIPFSGKLGGAIGNLANHRAAYPDINWQAFAKSYIEGLGLTYDEMTFQSSTYDLEASIFTEIGHIATHMIKLIRDFVDLVSCPAQIFVKRKKKGTRGSSVMPSKSNMWQCEAAIQMLTDLRDGCFAIARDLPSFPHAGNMARSYLMRKLGDLFAPGFVAIHRAMNEIAGDLEKTGCAANPERINAIFDEYPGMAGSSIQTVLKRLHIQGDAYREIEAIAINPDGTYANAGQFAAGLEKVFERNGFDEPVRTELRALLVPFQNIGYAHELATATASRLRGQAKIMQSMLERYAKPLVETI